MASTCVEDSSLKYGYVAGEVKGLNGNIFNTHRDANDKDYFEGWIYTWIFFMKCKSQQLALNEKKNYLLQFLRIDW